MSSARVHARNLMANWAGHGANLAVLFFLSPFIVHTLGKVDYGIWSLLSVVTGYMGMLDLGIRAGTGRYIMFYLGRGDDRRVDETIRTGLGAYSAIAGLLLLASVGIGWAFPILFPSVPEEYHSLLLWLVPLLAVNLWLAAFGAVNWSVLAAHERFDLAQGCAAVVLVGKAVAILLVLNGGLGLLGLALATVASTALGSAGTWWLARRVYRPLRVWPWVFHRSRLRELLRYGMGAFVSAIATKVIGQTDLIVVGATISISAVAVYSVGAMLVWYSGTFFDQIVTTFFPAIQRAAAIHDYGNVGRLYLRAARLYVVFALVVFLGFIIFGAQFIALWMGPEFSDAVLILSILSASRLVAGLSYAAPQVLLAVGRVRFVATAESAEAALNLLLTLAFVLLFKWNMVGVASGTFVALLLVRIVHAWYACRCIDMPLKTLGLSVGLPLLLGGSLFAVVCWVIRWALPGGSWWDFSVQVALASAAYVPIAVFLLLPREDRSRLLARIGLVSGVRAKRKPLWEGENP